MAMEAQNQKNGSSSSTNDALLPDDHTDSLTNHNPAFGTVIPNRIFVGGIDYKVTERELRRKFSQHGAVTDVKIVLDHLGMSKGYGFVTFESQADAQKILNNANGITFKDKKLSIGQAFRKRQPSGRLTIASTASCELAVPQHAACGSVYLTTATGCPYTYYNGVAYFHCPTMNPPSNQWLPPSSPMGPHSQPPVYEQPASHQYQVSSAFQGSSHFSPRYHLTSTAVYLAACSLSASPSLQCVPNQYQWNAVQWQMPSNAVLYSQQSQFLYLPADGGATQPPVSFVEDSTVEFLEPTVQDVYPVYAQRAEGMTHVFLQHDPGKNQTFPPWWVHLKPRHRRHIHRKDCHHLPESTEP